MSGEIKTIFVPEHTPQFVEVETGRDGTVNVVGDPEIRFRKDAAGHYVQIVKRHANKPFSEGLPIKGLNYQQILEEYKLKPQIEKDNGEVENTSKYRKFLVDYGVNSDHPLLGHVHEILLGERGAYQFQISKKANGEVILVKVMDSKTPKILGNRR